MGSSHEAGDTLSAVNGDAMSSMALIRDERVLDHGADEWEERQVRPLQLEARKPLASVMKNVEPLEAEQKWETDLDESWDVSQGKTPSMQVRLETPELLREVARLLQRVDQLLAAAFHVRARRVGLEQPS